MPRNSKLIVLILMTKLDRKYKLKTLNVIVKIEKNSKSRKEKAFKDVRSKSIVNADILNFEVYGFLSSELIELLKQGPEYECTICFRSEFRRCVIRLDPDRYDKRV